MTRRKKYLAVAAIVLIYVAIAIVGFFIVYFIKTTVIKTPASVPSTTTVTPTAVPAPSGFKTYQNTEQKYSLNYPEELTIKESSYGFGVNTVELRSDDNNDPAYAPDVQILTVPKTIAKAIGQDFDSYYTMADKSSKTIKSPFGQDNGAESFTKIRNREVNGLRAIDYTSVPSPNPDNQEPELGTMVETTNALVIFASGFDDREQIEEVLKTFAFTK